MALPPKEQALFKKIIRCYEQKNYKQGLKAAKAILSQPQFANHGETLAMKGLTLNCLDRKEEAYELARLGLRNDIKSHVCWHVYGLLYRSDKNFPEAIKCYRNALKFDKENLQILRDLAVLQIHIRDLEGFKETRHTILKIRPHTQAAWISYAIGQHMLNEHTDAIDVIEIYESAQANAHRSQEDYEMSELILYKADILEDAGKFQEAIDCLKKQGKLVRDKLGMKEALIRLYLGLGEHAKAEKIVRKLINLNPEKAEYYHQLEQATKLTDGADETARLKLYEDILEKFPRALVPRRRILDFVTGAKFEELVDTYMRSNVRRGMHPLFRILRGLYSDPAKAATLGKLILGYVSALKAEQKFDTKAETPKESPTAIVWALFLASQHHDYIGEHEEALRLIDEAIEHTPTVIELYMFKSKIYKHAGDIFKAAYWYNYVRELDTADRFINSKCVKYQLRAGEMEAAEANIATFTRETEMGPLDQLREMQCMWFELEEAAAFRRKGDLGRALKKLHEVDKHFTQFVDDQFDFHSYCIRKMTLRAYVRLLRMEDRVRDHRFYTRAALMAIDIYLGLHDKPQSSGDQSSEDPALAGMTEAEKKKYLSKQRKAAKKAAAAAAEAQTKEEAAKPAEGAKGGKKSDEDPDGAKLAKTETPLDEAIKFLRPLQELAADNIESHLAAFEIFYRKKKPLLMLQSIKRARKIDEANPRLHTAIVRLATFLNGNPELHPVVKQVIQSEFSPILADTKKVAAFNDAFINAHKSSLSHVTAGAEMMVHLDSASSAKAAALVNGTDLGDVKVCTATLESLKGPIKASDSDVAAYKAKAKKAHPLALAFAQTSLIFV